MRGRTTFALELEAPQHHDNADGTRRVRVTVVDNEGTAYVAGVLHLTPHDLETLTAILEHGIGPYPASAGAPRAASPWD